MCNILACCTSKLDSSDCICCDGCKTGAGCSCPQDECQCVKCPQASCKANPCCASKQCDGCTKNESCSCTIDSKECVNCSNCVENKCCS